ncbi:ABC transporter substrate-binding protein [Lutibaculum baratangense]|uniref:Peptide/opine/nickel uptake family ABC transporter, periplasmic substrate-binding protein n=1 Tax=Lutibaculum baratangense AMV1 TaxID=631454 RepID=V4RMZ6_9HYPH|nr:ABC transporter substrate-binding protein [Lutibaculum baratangense]ESR24595.1 Peptide/opine/nickel uptake family ABC transporter, periplasmic substrate-binding protein [Lutibaculum baratangense AMV1]
MTLIFRIAAILAALPFLAAPALAAKDTLTMGMTLEPPHLDPTATAAAATDEVVYANVFEGLTRIDAAGAVQPALAASWDVTEDGTVYTFHLREGVSFHDGTQFDAEDVVFSFERAMAEGSVNAQKQIFEPIEAVEALDPRTVKVTLRRPTGSFLFDLGWGDAVIVAPESADANRSAPVGTGPFRFERRVAGDRVELTRFEDYWGEAPALARATFKFIPDSAAAAAALLAGDIDAFANLPAPELVPQFEADPRFTVEIGVTEGETILAMNNAREPFSNLKVRQAISHALNRDAIIQADFDYGTPIGSHFSPVHPAYVDLTGTYPHDVEKAKALLREAGYAEGFEATLKLPPPNYARRAGEIIQQQLAQVGITVEIVPVEWAQWLEQVFKGADYDMTVIAHTEPMDIGIYARDDYYFGYDSAEFDGVMEELSAEADEGRRHELMAEAQRILAEDAVNGFLYQLPKIGVWNAAVEGLWRNTPIQANDLTEVRWRE